MESDRQQDEQETILVLWHRSEGVFSQNRYDGHHSRLFGAKRIETSSILLTAPHAVNHFLNEGNELKVADLYTGGLVRALGHVKGIAVAFNCARHPAINPHLGATPLDGLVGKFMRARNGGMIVDVHGCKNNPDFDIAIGVGGDEALQRQEWLITTLKKSAEQCGLRVAINPEGYQGKNHRSLVSRHRGAFNNLAIVQLEISKELRDPSGNRRGSIVAALTDTIDLALSHGLR